MSRKLKEIRRILTEHDVRGPRGALVAIEVALNSKNPNPEKKVKPLITATLTQTGNGEGEVEVITAEGFTPKHLIALIESLNHFGNEKFGECPGCEKCQPELEGTNPLALDPAFLEVLRGIAAKLKASRTNNPSQPTKKEGE